MASRIWRYPYARDCVGSIKVDSLDARKCVKMVDLSVHLNLGLSGTGEIADTDGVLDQPFVYGFCGMRHKDTAFKVCLCENVGKRGSMVNMETGMVSSSQDISENAVGSQNGGVHIYNIQEVQVTSL